MNLNDTFSHGPKGARRTFRVMNVHRIEGTFTVRYVVEDVVNGATFITYAHTGQSLRWNSRLYHAAESFADGKLKGN